MRLPPEELQRLLNATSRTGGGGADRAYTVRIQGKSGLLGALTLVAGLFIGIFIAVTAAVLAVVGSIGAMLMRKIAGVFQNGATTTKAEAKADVIDIESSVVVSETAKSQDP